MRWLISLSNEEHVSCRCKLKLLILYFDLYRMLQFLFLSKSRHFHFLTAASKKWDVHKWRRSEILIFLPPPKCRKSFCMEVSRKCFTSFMNDPKVFHVPSLFIVIHLKKILLFLAQNIVIWFRCYLRQEIISLRKLSFHSVTFHDSLKVIYYGNLLNLKNVTRDNIQDVKKYFFKSIDSWKAKIIFFGD